MLNPGIVLDKALEDGRNNVISGAILKVKTTGQKYFCINGSDEKAWNSLPTVVNSPSKIKVYNLFLSV